MQKARRKCLSSASLVVALITTAPNVVHASTFGTMCQEDFQNGWADTLSYAYDLCANFNVQLDTQDTFVFYTNLHNAVNLWQDPGDQYYLETVDLFFADTHGAQDSSASYWAMWDYWVEANSINMHLGDEDIGLSILATWSCHTLYNGDGRDYVRMDDIFSGGLKLALGSHDLVYNGWTMTDTGEDFASCIQAGWSMIGCWHDAANDFWNDNDVAGMATGADANDCSSRIGAPWNMTRYGTSYKWEPRLRGSQIGAYCRLQWDNV